MSPMPNLQLHQSKEHHRLPSEADTCRESLSEMREQSANAKQRAGKQIMLQNRKVVYPKVASKQNYCPTTALHS